MRYQAGEAADKVYLPAEEILRQRKDTLCEFMPFQIRLFPLEENQLIRFIIIKVIFRFLKIRHQSLV